MSTMRGRPRHVGSAWLAQKEHSDPRLIRKFKSPIRRDRRKAVFLFILDRVMSVRCGPLADTQLEPAEKRICHLTCGTCPAVE